MSLLTSKDIPAFEAYKNACRTEPMCAYSVKPSAGIMLYRWDIRPLEDIRIPQNGEVTVVAHLGGESQVRVFTKDGLSQQCSQPGDITLIPRGQPIKYSLNGSVDFATIHFPANATKLFDKEFGDKLLNLRHCFFAWQDDYVISSVKTLLNMSAPTTSLDKRYTHSVLESLSWHLLKLVSDNCIEPISLSETVSHQLCLDEENYFSTIVTEIETRLNEQIKVEELASIAGLGRTLFYEKFIEYFGQSPYRFIVNRRIEKAKGMLLDNLCSITEIAYNLGFSSASHFSSSFKSVTGMTPKEFLEKTRNSVHK